MRQRPSDFRKTVVSAYVSDRLAREHRQEGRGYIARVARATGFRGPSLSTVARGKPVGEDMAEGLGRFWGLGGYDGLRRTAEEWWKAEGKTIVGAANAARVVRDPADGALAAAKAMAFAKGFDEAFVDAWEPPARETDPDVLWEELKAAWRAFVRAGGGPPTPPPAEVRGLATKGLRHLPTGDTAEVKPRRTKRNR